MVEYKISEEAVNNLITILQELPFKYAAPILKNLQDNLIPVDNHLQKEKGAE